MPRRTRFRLWRAALGTLLGLATGPSCTGERPEATLAAPPQGVLFVTVDALRADRLGAYGFRPSVTPHIDALAASGTTFLNAYTTANITQPAVVTMHSGLYPAQHGVDSNVTGAALPEGEVTVAALMGSAGYATGAFISHPWIAYVGMGLREGFEHWEGVSHHRAEPGGESADDVYRRETPAGPMTDRALRWLGALDGRPFFAWIHYLDPHDPYEPPPGVVPPPPRGSGESERDRMCRLYAGEVANVDRHLGRLLVGARTAAAGRGLLVVLTSDHGEMLFDHAGFMAHGLYTYDAEIRIPLVASGPGFPEGARVATPVSLIDLLPTLGAVVEKDPGVVLPGVDLRGPAAGNALPPRLLFSESEYFRGEGFDDDFERRVPVEGGKWRTVIGPDFKAVYYPSTLPPGYRLEVFDLEDRKQRAPRRASDAQVARILSRLRAHVDNTDAQAWAELTPEQHEILRSLGYLP